MRILVAGGAGYIGSVLVPMLLEQGHDVRVLDRLQFGDFGLSGCLANRRLDLCVGDVTDQAVVARAVAGVDTIVHLAALVGYPACAADAAGAWSANVEGTRTLLAARRVDQALVFASTGSVYGRVSAVCDEGTPVLPLTLYGRSKAEAEKLVAAAGNTVTYRYATAFGPSPMMRVDLLPNNFVLQALRDRVVEVYQADARRSFVHVLDVARSVVFALDRWRELRDDTFNVGDERLNETKRRLAQRVSDATGCAVSFIEQGSDEDQRDCDVSYAKIRRAGYRTEVGLADGIAGLVRCLSRVTSPVAPHDQRVAIGRAGEAARMRPAPNPTSPALTTSDRR